MHQATHQSTPHVHYLPVPNIRGLLPPKPVTHEEFICQIRELALARLNAKDAERLAATKLTYGAADGVRGVTHFNAWANGSQHDFITISSIGEEGHTQLTGTVLHELGHVLAGAAAGHGKEWRAACRQLGLHTAQAAGQSYSIEHFATELQDAIAALSTPNDGKPTFGIGALPVSKFRPCGVGIGTRGGTSRGKGSGSRMRKYVCSCQPAQIVRAATDSLRATCDLCGTSFSLADLSSGGAQ